MAVEDPGPSSPRSSSPDRSLDLPSLQPLSHDHPLLSAPTFSADGFLLSRIHIPLEELRAELRSYLAVLREELVQLINDDYEEFISLGTGLRGENGRLKRLQGPLRDLGAEVGAVRDVLVMHQTKVQGKLDERAALREERALLDLLQRLFETLIRAEGLLDGTHDEERSKLVQRVAGEYTQLVYLSSKAQAEGCEIVATISERVNVMRAKISNELSTLLLDGLDDPLRLRQILKTYELIEGWDEAEEVIRQHFRSFCKSHISASALHVPPSPMVPITPATPHASNPFDKLSESTPLAALYNRILSQVDIYKPLLASAEELSDRFDFFAGVLWPEIAEIISQELGSTIFSAGRPDELHKHYTTTHDFISLLENLAPSSRSIVDMRAGSAYQTFERRWQLPVYFQLRWKEIISTFEGALSGPTTPAGEWALAQSASAWKALSTCWDPEVYIPELSNRFWRTSLQISVRYGVWLRKQLDEGANEEDGAVEEQSLKMASAAVVDLQLWKNRIHGIEAIRENGLEEHLAIPMDVFTEKIIDIVTRRCADSLKLVRSVASQLRAAPTKMGEPTPSYFIPTILKPLHSFYTTRPSLEDKEWSTSIVDSVMTSYAGILAGVRKTEDLLRRHRKSKKTGFSLFGGGANTPEEGTGDEERFRKQMEVDINALRKEAESLGVQVEGLVGWKELVGVVNRPAE